MKKALHLPIILGFVVFASVASAQVKETYSATAVGTRANLGGQSIPMTIRITEYTEEGALEKFAQLEREGQEALRRELEDRDVGQIGPDGEVGLDIAIARRVEAEDGYQVILVVARNFSFEELRGGDITRGYPFSWVELKLDEQGRGQGRVVVAGRLEFDEEGHLSIAPYEIESIRLLNVRRR